MNIVIDIVFVLFVLLMAFVGYKKGFLDRAWWVIDIVLIVFLGMNFVPKISQALSGTGFAVSIENAIAGAVSGGLFGKTPAELASLALDIIAWAGLAVAVLIVMAIFKAILKSLRKVLGFRVLDGILGSLYGIVMCLVILLVLGALAGTFTQFAPVSSAYDLCSQTTLFKYVFGANPFQETINAHFPLGTWIYGALQSQ